MPLYEFVCRRCKQGFEVLVLLSTSRLSEVPPCPSCEGRDVERIVSSFAVNSDATRQMNRTKGRMRVMKEAREQKDAEHRQLLEHHKEHEPPPLK